MAKKQSRRSISINRSLFEEVKGRAELANVPLSQFTEEALRHRLAANEALNVPAPPPAPASSEGRSGADIIRECGDDGAKWARAFMSTLADHIKAGTLDEGTMIGWFANAIETACAERIAKLRRAQAEEAEAAGLDRLTASEAINGFVGWLTTRPAIVELGSSRNCAGLVDLIERFSTANNLSDPRDGWHLNLSHPDHVDELDGRRLPDVPGDQPEPEPAPDPALESEGPLPGEPVVVYDEDPAA